MLSTKQVIFEREKKKARIPCTITEGASTLQSSAEPGILEGFSFFSHRAWWCGIHKFRQERIKNELRTETEILFLLYFAQDTSPQIN